MEDTPQVNEDTTKEPLIEKNPPKQKFSRTRTMGVKVKDKKTLFTVGTDGKLQEVKINPIVPDDKPTD